MLFQVLFCCITPIFVNNDTFVDCGTQVEKQGKACRKELEHALTRAAMDQDLGAIDEAEVVLFQKEHKLERLLAQKNMFEAALVRAYLTAIDRSCIACWPGTTV